VRLFSAEVKERIELYLYSPLGHHGLQYGELLVKLGLSVPDEGVVILLKNLMCVVQGLLE
jgi:hypothetical protein